MDCVANETYAGLRALDDVVLDAGTVMVNRADASDGVRGTLCEAPPLEQLHRAHTASNARAREREPKREGTISPLPRWNNNRSKRTIILSAFPPYRRMPAQ